MISQQENNIHVNEEETPSPPHKKSKAYKIVYTLGFVCLGVGLLLWVTAPSRQGDMLGVVWALAAFVIGILLLAIGAIDHTIHGDQRNS